jgi:hypothetical protein
LVGIDGSCSCPLEAIAVSHSSGFVQTSKTTGQLRRLSPVDYPFVDPSRAQHGYDSIIVDARNFPCCVAPQVRFFQNAMRQSHSSATGAAPQRVLATRHGVEVVPDEATEMNQSQRSLVHPGSKIHLGLSKLPGSEGRIWELARQVLEILKWLDDVHSRSKPFQIHAYPFAHAD